MQYSRYHRPQTIEHPLTHPPKHDSVISILASKLVSSMPISDISELVLESAQRFTGSTYGLIGYMDLEEGYMISPPMINGTWDSITNKAKTNIFKKYAGSGGGLMNRPLSLLNNSPQSDTLFAEISTGSLSIHNFLCASLDWRRVGWSNCFS
jgi:hypothetical protein